jgi:hypothetical protein
MSDDPRNVRSTELSSEAEETASYRERLDRAPLLLDPEADEAQDPEAARPDVAALRALVENTERQGTAFQSVAVAAVQILERALCYEREAAEAALSLGQQEKLESMVETVERAAAVLRSALNAQGAKVMHLCAEGDQSTPSDNQPWWFALTDALEILEEGTGRMSSLTTAQPTGSPARELSQLIAQLLRGHHDELLLEADDWIS